MKKTRVTIVGAGFVGSACANSIMLKDIADEIFLVDINQEKAESEALDIAHSAAMIGNTVVKAATYEEAKNSDIVVITAGVQPKYGETRLDVLGRSIAMYKHILPEVCKYNKDAILLVVGNPVDVLTYYTYKFSGFPKERVISAGTVIDSNRLRYYVAKYLNVENNAVQGVTLGEHGDSQIALWDTVRIHNIPMEQYCKDYNIEFNDEVKEKLLTTVRESGFYVIKGKGYTNFGIGQAVSIIAKAILNNENVMLPVGTVYEGQHGIDDVIMSAPCVVNRDGVREMVKVNIPEEQLTELKKSATILKDMIKKSMN